MSEHIGFTNQMLRIPQKGVETTFNLALNYCGRYLRFQMLVRSANKGELIGSLVSTAEIIPYYCLIISDYPVAKPLWGCLLRVHYGESLKVINFIMH